MPPAEPRGGRSRPRRRQREPTAAPLRNGERKHPNAGKVRGDTGGNNGPQKMNTLRVKRNVPENPPGLPGRWDGPLGMENPEQAASAAARPRKYRVATSGGLRATKLQVSKVSAEQSLQFEQKPA